MLLQLRCGLMYCGIGECRQIPGQTDEFVQILNRNSNHWMAISAVNCAPGDVEVYDNLYRTVSKDIKELVVSMIHTYKTTLSFTKPPMVMQMFFLF